MTKILFPYSSYTSKSKSLLLLSLRIIIGLLFLKHGLDKWENFELLQDIFPDPLGITNRSSLILAIFAEVICSIGFILGFLFRLSVLPMITSMAIAYFMVHAADPFATKELSFIYLALFLLLLIAGPGQLSIDALIGKSINRRQKSNSRVRAPLKL